MKLLYILWEDSPRSREERERIVLGELVPALQAHTTGLWVDLDDTHSKVPSPSPFPLGAQRPVGVINAFVEGLQARGTIEAAIQGAGLRCDGYAVDQSIYKDYGDNDHSGPRDWPDGQRSPGVTAVTFFERPARIPEEEWIKRWHGRMSPVSESIQPRQRYVRNRVTAVLTEGSPPLGGVVEEVFASGRHITNPFLFYGAKNPLRLVVNLVRILAAVMSFITIWRVQTVVMSEHFIDTVPPAQTPPG